MMNAQYSEAMAQQQHQMMVQQMQWEHSQQAMQAQEWQMQQQFDQLSIDEEAEKWKNEFKMDAAFDAAKLSYEEEQANILNSSNSMLEVMMSDPDPRFQNSQFLHFLKRIQQGEVVIEGKEIRETQPDTVAMDKAWNEAELIHQSNLANLDPALQAAKEQEAAEALKAQQMLEDNWKEKLESYEQ